MKRIYIAGKLNAMAVDYLKNVHTMIDHAELVRQQGFAVFVPCLDCISGIMFGDWEYEDYTRNSMAWLEVSDAVFVCPDSDDSPGTQKEIARAKELDIPVFHSVIELNRHFRK